MNDARDMAEHAVTRARVADEHAGYAVQDASLAKELGCSTAGDTYYAIQSEASARDAWGVAAVLALIWLLTPPPCKVCGGRCRGSAAV